MIRIQRGLEAVKCTRPERWHTSMLYLKGISIFNHRHCFLNIITKRNVEHFKLPWVARVLWERNALKSLCSLKKNSWKQCTFPIFRWDLWGESKQANPWLIISHTYLVSLGVRIIFIFLVRILKGTCVYIKTWKRFESC